MRKFYLFYTFSERMWYNNSAGAESADFIGPRCISSAFYRQSGFLTPQSLESLIRLIFLRQIYFYVLRTIVLCSIIYLYIIYRRQP